ncbi:peptide deformylase 1A, chloroplastic [Cannabis sativa]|uniref:peptide deformylase 1A, chloroplastic n=1 Tax=Cannabis sativa TaxID=3483 RepID=UPI0029CA5CF2|nr:peptide deformylase 1A, chloroplastic [Cannabis sativa]
MAMEIAYRLSFRLLPLLQSEKCLNPGVFNPIFRKSCAPVLGHVHQELPSNTIFTNRRSYSRASPSIARAGWLLGLGEKKKTSLPDIVKAGDPVLHEPAKEVEVGEIGSDKIQKIIDDMVAAMRKAPGVGLAAPQIGVPLRIVVLEDTKEYISYAPKEETKAQDRRPFDLLVIINPKLKKKSKRTAMFFEGCLSVDGFRAMVERCLDVEVSGLDRYGNPIKIDASGWQARILQHECDHLEGTLYVDTMVPKTFRTVENLDLPLADGCPKLGVR